MREISQETILKCIREMNGMYEKEGLKLVGLFGSYARGDNSELSDIDIAYEIDQSRFHPDNAFAQLDALQTVRETLQKRLGRRVDLVSVKSDNPVFKDRLEKELLSA